MTVKILFKVWKAATKILSRHDLKTHVEHNAEDWTPKDETFEAVLDSMEADTYYEVSRKG